jgi:hypothetical protein
MTFTRLGPTEIRMVAAGLGLVWRDLDGLAVTHFVETGDAVIAVKAGAHPDAERPVEHLVREGLATRAIERG